MIKIEDPKIREIISQYLTEFITNERNEKIRKIIENRTRHITVVLEDLYQTQNISAVMRTCECYGVQDIHVIEKENDFFIHQAISMGANKWLSIYNYENKEHNAKNCIDQLKQKGYTIIATLPSKNSIFLDDLPIEQPTAFLFGTELTGLSEEAVAMADHCIKIPMYGFTESFNISNSVAIILSFFIEKLHHSHINWKLTDTEKEDLYLEWLQKSIKTPDLIIEQFLKSKKLC